MHTEPDGDVTQNADAFSATRNKIGVGLLAAAFAFLVGAILDLQCVLDILVTGTFRVAAESYQRR